jgi:UDP-2,4-diacetamido-2,4,6-trideoxy-beta-L-altropyranose hydrolase
MALAQAWQTRGGEAAFITACESDSLQQRLVQEGFGLIPVERAHPDPDDWETTSAVLRVHPGAWMVLDGYHFDPSYQCRVRKAGHPLLVIDDMAHLEHYWGDVILNQNIHAQTLQYSAEPNTQLLLGTHYALLRREFSPWRDWKREIPEVARKVLVTMGGSDPDNVTLKVIRALTEVGVDDLEAVVVVGASNPHYEALHTAACASPHAIRLVRNATNMPELMAWADVAISAAGTSGYELAYLGVPMCLIAIAGNQEQTVRLLELAGVASGLANLEDAALDQTAARITTLIQSRESRALMSTRGRELVDGFGAGRVVMRLLATGLHLRPARRTDCELIWEWANDPGTRAASFQQGPIPWEEHLRWFEGKLTSETARIYIALIDGMIPLGQVRFEIDGLNATVSVSLDGSQRGRGYGSAVIWTGCTRLFGTTQVENIDAYTKPGNVASLLAFARAGFRNLGSTNVAGNAAIHLGARREEWVP